MNQVGGSPDWPLEKKKNLTHTIMSRVCRLTTSPEHTTWVQTCTQMHTKAYSVWLSPFPLRYIEHSTFPMKTDVQ